MKKCVFLEIKNNQGKSFMMNKDRKTYIKSCLYMVQKLDGHIARGEEDSLI